MLAAMKRGVLVLGMIMMAGTASQAGAATAKRDAAGALKDGTRIEAITLSNSRGISARILTYGATLQALSAPDRNGRIDDVTLGYDDPADYDAKANYFGVTVERYANRIAGGKFRLDGSEYQVPLNNGVNSLHGGGRGFDRKVWAVKSVTSGPSASVVLSLLSPDGEMGYPGEVAATVSYALLRFGRGGSADHRCRNRCGDAPSASGGRCAPDYR